MPPKKGLTGSSKTDAIKDVLRLNGSAKAFIAEHIRGLIRRYAIQGIKDPRATDLIYDILFVDPITTTHFGQFQGMWGYRNSKSVQHVAWWGIFRAFLRDCFDKTRIQMNRYAKENPEQVPLTQTTGVVRDTGENNEESGKGINRDEWYPGIAKLRTPNHQTAMGLHLVTPPGPPVTKKRKIDSPSRLATVANSDSGTDRHPFRVCILRLQEYQPTNFSFDFYSENATWHLSSISNVSYSSVLQAVKLLCPNEIPPRDLFGCLVHPRDHRTVEEECGGISGIVENAARACSATYQFQKSDSIQLDSDEIVEAFFAINAYNPLTILAVAMAQARNAMAGSLDDLVVEQRSGGVEGPPARSPHKKVAGKNPKASTVAKVATEQQQISATLPVAFTAHCRQASPILGTSGAPEDIPHAHTSPGLYTSEIHSAINGGPSPPQPGTPTPPTAILPATAPSFVATNNCSMPSVQSTSPGASFRVVRMVTRQRRKL